MSESAEAAHLVPLFRQGPCANSADSMTRCVFLKLNYRQDATSRPAAFGMLNEERCDYSWFVAAPCLLLCLTPRQMQTMTLAVEHKLWLLCTPSSCSLRSSRRRTSKKRRNRWHGGARRQEEALKRGVLIQSFHYRSLSLQISVIFPFPLNFRPACLAQHQRRRRHSSQC